MGSAARVEFSSLCFKVAIDSCRGNGEQLSRGCIIDIEFAKGAAVALS